MSIRSLAVTSVSYLSTSRWSLFPLQARLNLGGVARAVTTAPEKHGPWCHHQSLFWSRPLNELRMKVAVSTSTDGEVPCPHSLCEVHTHRHAGWNKISLQAIIPYLLHVRGSEKGNFFEVGNDDSCSRIWCDVETVTLLEICCDWLYNYSKSYKDCSNLNWNKSWWFWSMDEYSKSQVTNKLDFGVREVRGNCNAKHENSTTGSLKYLGF